MVWTGVRRLMANQGIDGSQFAALSGMRDR